jgi:SAM-dependent methyltransferase
VPRRERSAASRRPLTRGPGDRVTPIDGYGAASYGDSYADVYDDWYPLPGDTEAAVEHLAAAAGHRPVLELGVGTGRLAIPLAQRQLDVWGVDSSAAMLNRLAAKPGGGGVRTFLGDIATLAPPSDAPRFGLVFAAYNTFCLLAEEAAQRACLQRVAEAVASGGQLVLEVFVPPIAVAPGGVVEVSQVTADRLVLRAFRRWPDAETFEGHHVELSETGGVRLRPWRMRAPGPAALDALAAAAGWRLAHRAGGWAGEPFTGTSRRHVSTYERS